MIKPGRPRVAVTPEQVRKLAEGKRVTTWKQIAAELGISVPTALRLYKVFRGNKG